MNNVDFVMKNLTPKQRQALLMRYGYGWRMKRIALRMGSSPQAVSALIQRAQRAAGMPRRCFDVVRPYIDGPSAGLLAQPGLFRNGVSAESGCMGRMQRATLEFDAKRCKSLTATKRGG